MTQRTSEETFREEGHYPLGQKSREMVWNEPREVPTVSGYGKITGALKRVISVEECSGSQAADD